MAGKDVGPGTRVSEYVLTEKLGEGGFGTVWKAHHHLWKDRVVAVKIPAAGKALDQLTREGLIQYDLQKLDNRHIVRTLGIDTAAEPPYFVMEFVEGASLREVLAERGRLDTDTVVAYGVQILEALSHAHGQGVVHCDLKPENVLVDGTGTVKLTDFGLGRRLDPADVSLLLSEDLDEDEGQAVAGTLEYMAPEQRQGERDDPRVDIYAFGVVLFEMITGERPQPGDLPGDLVPSTPKRFDEIFRRCYVRAERRFQTVEEILPLFQEMEPPSAASAPEAPLPGAWADAAAPGAVPSEPAGPGAPAEEGPAVEAASGETGGPASAPEPPSDDAPGPRGAPPVTRPVGETPQGMVHVPAGRFTMGVSDPESDAYPEHVRFVEDVFLDLLPVTNGRFLDFTRDGGYRARKLWGEDGWAVVEKCLDSTGRPGPRYWSDGKYPSGMESHPVVGVCFFEARAFARWAGKKLPSEEEWEKAARGTDGRAYPWGDEFNAKLCNTWESGRGATTKVGRYRRGASPFGLLDMAGNVLEWTRSFYGAYPGNEAENPHFGELYRVLRGGAWYFKQKSAASTMRFIMRPTLRWNYVGFRCAKDP